MNLDDAKACWQSQEQLAGVAMSDSQLLEMVREKSRAFDAKIRKRDLREILVMVVCAPFVLVTLLRPSSWVARAGAVLVLAGCAFIYWKLRRARRAGDRAAAGAALSLTEVLRAQRAKVDAQIDLLESVLWWYIAPLAIGAVMVVAGALGITGFTIVYAFLVGLMSWRIYVANRRAVARVLRPQRDEITQLLQQAGE